MLDRCWVTRSDHNYGGTTVDKSIIYKVTIVKIATIGAINYPTIYNHSGNKWNHRCMNHVNGDPYSKPHIFDGQL